MLVTRLLATAGTTPSTRPAQRAPARRGFTLGEMVVALMLFSLVGGGILTVVMRQQRFYRSTAEIIKQQGHLRQGSSVLPADLRGISTSDTLVNDTVTAPGTKYNADIYTKNEWSIEFRRTFGSSLICAKRTAAPFDTITLYPKRLNRVDAITNASHMPVEGDSILILDDWTMVGPGDDRWRAYEIKQVTPVSGNDGCPWKTAENRRPLLELSDTARKSYKIVLDRALSQTVIVGAPVRFFRRARYEAYQAPDNQWYLGYSDCLRTYLTQCSDVTPVSGPYQDYTGNRSESGLFFTYYDSLGTQLDATMAEPRQIARVEVVMRAQTQQAVTRTGAGAGEVYRDSLVFTISIRNRR